MTRPANISLARVFVTCPSCSADITSPTGESDWTLDQVLLVRDKTDPVECPKCDECVQAVQVVLPEYLDLSP